MATQTRGRTTAGEETENENNPTGSERPSKTVEVGTYPKDPYDPDLESPADYMDRMELYFEDCNIVGDRQQMNACGMGLKGPGLRWHLNVTKGRGSQEAVTTWAAYKQAFLDAHQTLEDLIPWRYRISELTRNGSVADYVKEFSRLMLPIEHLGDEEARAYFYDGVGKKYHIWQVLTAPTLADMIKTAKAEEVCRQSQRYGRGADASLRQLPHGIPMDSIPLRFQLSRLSRRGSVKPYIKQFERLSSKIPDLGDEEARAYFYDGVGKAFHTQGVITAPTIEEMIKQALLVEKSNLTREHYQKLPAGPH